jgi:predicted metal-dependent hydrolase
MIQLPRMRRGTKPYALAVQVVRRQVSERTAHFAKHYNISYGTISIRKQKTRWGSCSRARNLSFNYRLGFLPLHLVDYIIVHELCHLIEHNHSAKFWALVEQIFPEPKTLHKELRQYRF